MTTVFLIRLLVESSVRSALIAGLVAAILGALRLRDARLRHAAWTGVLATMMCMPVLQHVSPSIELPMSFSRLDWFTTDAVGTASMPSSDASRRLAAAAHDDREGQPQNDAGRSGHNPAARPEPVEERGPQPRSQPLSWAALLAIGVYCAGALVLATHAAAGLRSAARIRRTSHPVRIDVSRLPIATLRTARIRESEAVVTPVTVGAVVPTILLPVTWRQWNEERLRAVLAHECAHVRRRDPLVSLLARVNSCLFWFNPVAWWLERALADTAEQVCDDAAVVAIGAREAYAGILLDMARLVSRRRARVAWQHVGIGGSGLLRRRIDRILTGSDAAESSPRRKAAAAICGAAATFVVVSCQPRSASVETVATTALEQSDRKLRRDLERALQTQFPVGNIDAPDSAQLEALEVAAARDPDNLTTLRALLVAYWMQPPADVAKRRARILWLIEHHPETPLAGSIEARLFPNDLEPAFPGDPAGYQQAKALWLSLTDRPGVASQVLRNAVSFLETTDPLRAEQLLLRARARDPDGPWTAQLGRLYATVLAGSSAVRSQNRIQTINRGAPRSAIGLAVRKTLGESRDHALLTATGWFLARGVRGPAPFREFDPDYWAEWCFRRALQVKPAAVLAHTELIEIRSRFSWRRGEPLWSEPPARAYESVAALPETERFELLPHLARSACQSLESMARWDDDPLIRDRIEMSRRDAKRYAEDALALAPKYRNRPQYGTAIYLANMALGTLALRDGDTKKAVLFLRNASRAPTSEELAYSRGMASSYQWHLAANLLKLGERDAVLDFLDRMAATSAADRFELREAAAEIRRGGTPRL